MSLQELDVLQYLLSHLVRQQREIAAALDMSLGVVNKSLRNLIAGGYLTKDYIPTEKARALGDHCRPERAVILAAGYGMRMIPASREVPKGLIEIDGEPLIEHTIRQLHEAGIREIYVVTGFMKEQYEYLTEKYGVVTLPCMDYQTRNNLYSLLTAKAHLENAYIIPCDVYFYVSPFRSPELYSWYMMSTEQIEEGGARVTRSREVVYVDSDSVGNRIIGLCYLKAEDASAAQDKLEQLTLNGKNSTAWWEAIISDKKRLLIPARMAAPADAVEINTFEQLRDIDYYNRQLQTEVIDTIRNVFNVSYDEIENIVVEKKGLCNRSFQFSVHGNRYIMRIPGEGISDFVDRYAEAEVYEAIRGKGLCDENVYLDPATGYKIARFIDGVRNCDENDQEELRRCIQIVRKLHNMSLSVNLQIDLFDAAAYVKSLWTEPVSQYRDYEQVEKDIFGTICSFVRENALPSVLIHGDCNPDNFLIYKTSQGNERIDLIDWEFSGMCDPMEDLASFIIYNKHDDPKRFADLVIDLYYPEGCPEKTRLLVYCYCAVASLYCSNWCEFKIQNGLEMGNYSLIQYRNAKNYLAIFQKEYAKLVEADSHVQD